MRILGLDLGTKTGWALGGSEAFSSGTWQLATPKEIAAQAKAGKSRCCDCRFKRLQDLIQELAPIEAIYFEDVEFSTFTYQTQLWAGFRTVLTLLYPIFVPRLIAVPVGTLKKYATGKGNATKEMMDAALRSTPYYPTKHIPDDNEVDAIHLLRYGIRQQAFGLTR